MKLIFPMWRKGFVKVLAPVVTEALRRGHEVDLLHGADDKPGEAVDRNALAFGLWDFREHYPRLGIVNQDHMRVHGNDHPWSADAIIGDPSIGEMTDLPDGPRYALDFVWELRMRPHVAGVTHCWTSEAQRDLWGARPAWWIGDGPAVLAAEGDPITGMTALDAIPLVDPAAVRKKYNLGDRPILLFFALKFGGVSHLWRQTAYRWWRYVSLLYALRDYANRHQMTLVVKTRAKNRDPKLLHQLADRVVTDESLWPYTSAELAVTADLVVHFQSGAVFEAAAAGKPQLSIAVPQPHLAHFRGHETFFSREPGALQCWPLVVQSCGYADAADLLHENKVLTRVDEAQRQEYASRYLGSLDGKSASRVLDVVEARA